MNGARKSEVPRLCADVVLSHLSFSPYPLLLEKNSEQLVLAKVTKFWMPPYLDRYELYKSQSCRELCLYLVSETTSALFVKMATLFIGSIICIKTYHFCSYGKSSVSLMQRSEIFCIRIVKQK